MASTTPALPKLRLRVRRATPADVPSLVRIHYDAFGPGIMHRLMYPDGASESAQARFGRSLFPPPSAEDGDGDEDPVERFAMVAEVLPEGNEEGEGQPDMVAYAKWKLVREPLPEDKWEARHDMTAEELGEGVNADVYNAFIGDLHRLRGKWMKGDPCLHLEILACSSTRQRLGAGSALLAWGAELADRERRVMWVEASPAGYPLYRRFGYEDVEAQDLRVTELWGAARGEHEDWGEGSAVAFAGELEEGSFRTVVMRRLPRQTR